MRELGKEMTNLVDEVLKDRSDHDILSFI